MQLLVIELFITQYPRRQRWRLRRRFYYLKFSVSISFAQRRRWRRWRRDGTQIMKNLFASIPSQTTLYKSLATFYRRQKVTSRSKWYYIANKNRNSDTVLIYWLQFFFAISLTLNDRKMLKQMTNKNKMIEYEMRNVYRCREMSEKKSLLCLPITTSNNNSLVGFNFICSFVHSFVRWFAY